MTQKTDYHHGDLKSALIDAGIALLDEGGWDRLSLRACAAKAGVSHAAPAHHFGNRRGLLTALATAAFQRFTQALKDAQRLAGDAAVDRLNAAGRTYIRFALDNPGLFKLMFGAADLDTSDPDMKAAQIAAYAELGAIARPFLPADPSPDHDHGMRVSIWSMVHGYAHLALAGRLDMLGVAEDPFRFNPDLSKIVGEADHSAALDADVGKGPPPISSKLSAET